MFDNAREIMKKLSLHKVKDAVDTAYNTEAREVRRSVEPGIYIASRGRWVSTTDGCEQCRPCPGAEAYGWRGTLKQLHTLVADIEADYPHVKELWIEGGFDCADNLRAYHDGDYDPWVGSWEVLIWTRDNGWEEALCE
jgi:hypothetical protein